MKLADAVTMVKDLSKQLRNAGGRLPLQLDATYADALDELTGAVSKIEQAAEEVASE